jgi:hypothetical protein
VVGIGHELFKKDLNSIKFPVISVFIIQAKFLSLLKNFPKVSCKNIKTSFQNNAFGMIVKIIKTKVPSLARSVH